jgi:superfamily II DNA/RNA helicase
VALHGDMDQSARTAALDRFRRGEAELLVASDVAARGLDIPEVSHVFNFDVPHHPDDYVHRIGRTGRAGRSGTSITIVAPPDRKAVTAIERLIGETIPWVGEPAAAPAPREPSRERTDRGSRPRGRQSKPQRHHEPRHQPSRAAATPPQSRPVRERVDEDEASHLPAFLFRPVPVKA